MRGRALDLRATLPDTRAECPCPKKKCERRGRCQECYDHHAAKGKLPYCLRGSK